MAEELLAVVVYTCCCILEVLEHVDFERTGSFALQHRLIEPPIELGLELGLVPLEPSACLELRLVAVVVLQVQETY